ncbi:MAG: IS110 family transposase [Acetobacteraceae bacterium]|nr:IS110 family transposase [Acetobacteraceae bacterium]
MPSTVRSCSPAATHSQDGTLFVALELSLSHWLVAVSAPDASKVSKHRVPACDGPALLALLDRLRRQAEARRGGVVGVVSIQEAGRDGFWVHRLLEAHGVQSQVVDPASIAVNRRSRRAKTDRIDAEGLLRALMAWSRGERQVCSMVRPPTREAEDARRLTREREALVTERTRHANRIKGLLATQGVFGFEPTWQARRARLDELRTPEGQRLPPQLMAEILRQIERLELTMRQIASVEAERDAALAAECQAEDQAGAALASPEGPAPAAPVLPPSAALPRATGRETFGSSARDGAGARLLRLKGIGPETASVLRLEAFHRSFGNRREIAAYAGLTPTPWKSGGLDTEQGISKSGNARLRRTMVQVAWFWLRNQPQSALSAWYRERVGDGRGRIKRIAIVALARKLLIALWRLVTQGIVPEGAELKVARAA